jgi:ATP-dependent protease HslVU (ClpYQ) peptidase subunit
MTTIAACHTGLIMAADSRVTFWDTETDTALHATQCFKIWKTRKYIVGVAGDDTEIRKLREWLNDPTMPRQWKKGAELSAIFLARNGLYYLEEGGGIEKCRLPFHAIGSGATCALASMNTMHRLGLDIDPELAVLVAIDHDNGSGPPVETVRWKPIVRKPRVPRLEQPQSEVTSDVSANDNE